MVRELKHIHYRDNDFDGSLSTYNRHYYAHQMNTFNYLTYNNNHHQQQQVQFKRSSSRLRQQTQTNQCQRQLLCSHRDSRQNQENNKNNSANNVMIIGLKGKIFC
jgi:hypothetical protein